MDKRLAIVTTLVSLLVTQSVIADSKTYENVYNMYGFNIEMSKELKHTHTKYAEYYANVLELYYHTSMSNNVIDVTNEQIKDIRQKANTKIVKLERELTILINKYTNKFDMTVAEIFRLDREYYNLKQELDEQLVLIASNELVKLHTSDNHTNINNINSIQNKIEKIETKLKEQEKLENIGTIKDIEYPVKNGRVTSRFGTRVHPVTNKLSFHTGLDLAVPTGSGVTSIFGGQVEVSEEYGTLGRYIKINHGNGVKSLYGHLSKLLVETGDVIEQGQLIGLSGNTGRSTGPHLHFSVIVNNVYVNPTILLEYTKN